MALTSSPDLGLARAGEREGTSPLLLLAQVGGGEGTWEMLVGMTSPSQWEERRGARIGWKRREKGEERGEVGPSP